MPEPFWQKPQSSQTREINGMEAAHTLQLTRRFVREQFVSQGMAADVAIHRPQKDKGEDDRNHHAHVLLTLRKVDGRGFDGVKTRQWNTDKTLIAWREAWARLQNDYLAQGGHKARVDHRSLESQREEAIAQGKPELAAMLDREPEIHVGPQARHISKRGRTVESQDREVPVYGQRRRQSQFRTVRYSGFDAGSRAEYNAGIIARNARNVRQAVRRVENRDARMRNRLRYYQQQRYRAAEQMRDLERDRRSQEQAQRLRELLERRKLHCNGRITFLETLIDHFLHLMLVTRSYEDRALSRYQTYQLRYLMQERRFQWEQRAGLRQSR